MGNIQRLGLAKALIHKPRLLILDEPINGLDPSGIVEIRQSLSKMAKSGTTVFLSSHILAEISKVADRIGIIHQGRLIKEIFSEKLHLEIKQSLIIGTDDNTSAISLLSVLPGKISRYHQPFDFTRDRKAFIAVVSFFIKL